VLVIFSYDWFYRGLKSETDEQNGSGSTFNSKQNKPSTFSREIFWCFVW